MKTQIKNEITVQNFIRLRYLSGIFLVFSIFINIVDYYYPTAWGDDLLSFYKIMDTIIFVFAITTFLIYWFYKKNNLLFKEYSILITLFFIVFWAAIITAFDYSNFGLSTYISTLILCILYLFLSPKIISLVIWSSNICLISIFSFYNSFEDTISVVFVIIPFSIIANYISIISFKDKEKLIETLLLKDQLTYQLQEAEQNLMTEVEKQTKDLVNSNLELEESKQNLSLEKDRFFALIQNLQSGICYIDIKGNILELNDSLVDLLGSPSMEATKVINIFDYKPLKEFGYTNKLSQSIKNKEIIYGEGEYNSHWGKTIYVRYYIVPIIKNNLVEGVLCNLEDITERKALNRELIRAKEKAEESDQLKSSFLANMSHEIRTPMNGIMGFLQMLQEPDITELERKEFYSTINRSSERLLNTINDIIEFSNIDAGKLELNIAKVDINQCIEEHRKFFALETSKKGLDLKYEIDEALKNQFIVSDKYKLDSIIINLVKNAIKYTDSGGIKIKCQIMDDKIKTCISDSGCGISEENLNVIFERFRRDDSTISRNIEGSGLGLAITKAYVEKMGGEIWVESEPEKGSQFYFTIDYIPIGNI